MGLSNFEICNRRSVLFMARPTAAELKVAKRAKRAAATLDDPPPQPVLRAASADDCVTTKLGWLAQFQYSTATADVTAALTAPDGHPLEIIPGMVAQVDILTGRRTVLDYLLKPVVKLREMALTER